MTRSRLPTCGSRRHRGRGPCTRPAGWGTAHAGVGRCKYHGGVRPTGDRRLKHGLYSSSLHQVMTQRLKEWDEVAARIPDLAGEIATLRALLEHVAVKPRRRGPPKVDVDAVLKVMDRIVRAVDAQQRAEKRGMVSLLTVQRYLEAVGLVISKYVKDPDVLRAIEADARSIPLVPDRVE